MFSCSWFIELDRLNPPHDYVIGCKRTGQGQDTSVLTSTGSVSPSVPEGTGVHLCISSGLPWCTDVSKLAVKCVTQVTTVKELKIMEDVLSSRRSRRSSPCHPITRNSPGSECVFWAWRGVGKSCLASLSNVYASGPPVNTRRRSEEKRRKLTEVKELSLGWFLI